eukprot:2554875-Rhodomonas_salina.1
MLPLSLTHALPDSLPCSLAPSLALSLRCSLSRSRSLSHMHSTASGLTRTWRPEAAWMSVCVHQRERVLACIRKGENVRASASGRGGSERDDMHTWLLETETRRPAAKAAWMSACAHVGGKEDAHIWLFETEEQRQGQHG